MYFRAPPGLVFLNQAAAGAVPPLYRAARLAPPPMQPGTAHYATLGVPPTASQADIRRAFQSALMSSHADKGGGGDSDTVTRVKEAYDVLRDPRKRAAYDLGGDEAVAATAALPPVITVPQVQVPLAAVRGGTVVPVPLVRRKVCQQLGSGGTFRLAVGSSGDDGVPLPEESVTVDVPIPAGAVDGMVIEVLNQGHLDVDTGQRGHVHVCLRVAHTEGAYTRDCATLRTEVTVPLYRALLGGTVALPPLFGAPLSIMLSRDHIPAPGSEVVVQHMGLPVFGAATGDAGDLVVRVHVQLPAALTAQRALDIATLLDAPAEELIREACLGGETAGAAAVVALPLDAPAAQRAVAQRAAVERNVEAHHEHVTAASGGATSQQQQQYGGTSVQCAQQ